MAEVGQGPVSLSREVPGFVLNRMQVGGKLNVNHIFDAHFEFSVTSVCSERSET